jgi:general stress protein YciG
LISRAFATPTLRAYRSAITLIGIKWPWWPGLVCVGETRTNDRRSRPETILKKEDPHMASKTEHSTSKDKVEGQKGVSQEQVGSGKDKDPINFANNPERASAAGRKGGHESHKGD